MIVESKHAGTLPEGEYFKLDNKGKDIYHSWSLDLLSPEQQRNFSAYIDAQLRDMEERVRRGGGSSELAALKKTPVANRLRDWVTAQGLGVDPIQEEFTSGKIKFLPPNYRPELKFKLPMGETFLTREQAQHFAPFRRGYITQKLKLGESKEKKDYEGFVDFEPCTEEEYLAGKTIKKK